jgi:hypothetical protein
MLFDLRSRGRRRTVQVIYLGLAVLIGGGLILFGVGTGTGGGGLLNGITGNGSGGGQSQAVDQATKAALKAVRLRPSDPNAWSSLIQAYWSDAGQGSNFNTATSTYTASGKKELTKATDAWQRYLTLVKSPNPNIAILAARAYAQNSQFSQEAAAWEYVVQAEPTAAKGYECLAFSAYAAKQTRKGNLASAKALSMAPKLQRLTLKQALTASKTQPAYAQQC